MLWFLHEGAAGGANLALGEHLTLLKEMGYRISLVSPKPGRFLDHMSAEGIPSQITFFYLWIRRPDRPNEYRLKRLLRNGYAFLRVLPLVCRADVVCTNTLCSPMGALAARLLGKPHYWFIHEFGEEDHGFRLGWRTPAAYRLMARLSRKVVLNSQAVRNKWEQYVSSDKLGLLYNVVHMPFVPPHTRKDLIPPFRLLMLGQVSRGKGHKDAIRGVAELRNRQRLVLLDIVGSAWDEPYCQELMALISSLGLDEIVHLKPPVENPGLLMEGYHLLLMCSVAEAFGRVTVEALKCGLPVVASASGGSPEIIDSGINGRLYPSGDYMKLADEVESLMDPVVYARFSQETSRVYAKFNPRRGLEQLSDIFV